MCYWKHRYALLYQKFNNFCQLMCSSSSKLFKQSSIEDQLVIVGVERVGDVVVVRRQGPQLVRVGVVQLAEKQRPLRGRWSRSQEQNDLKKELIWGVYFVLEASFILIEAVLFKRTVFTNLFMSIIRME